MAESSARSQIVQELLALGIDQGRCEAAVNVPQNSTLEACITWIFDGGDEEGFFDSESSQTAAASGNPSPFELARQFGGLETGTGRRAQSETPEEIKMVILVREDLKMSAGKVGAQCSHAALAAYRSAQEKDGGIVLMTWTFGGEKIVVLSVKDETEMEQLSTQAQAKGLNTAAIHDAGRTEVASGTKTVVAIGPAHASAINEVTGHLTTL